MRIKTALAVFALFVILALLQAGARTVTEPREGIFVLTIGGRALAVEVADTALARVRGLSRREALPRDAGMLFVFPVSDYHGIWMKEMLFPLDIVWLEETEENTESTPRRAEIELRVVDIKKDAAPETFPEVWYPRAPARYVLEVNAGFAAAHALQRADTAVLQRGP